MTTNSRFAGLDPHGRNKPAAEAPTDDPKPDAEAARPDAPAPEDQSEAAPDEPADQSADQPKADAHASVTAAVFASEESKGRERLAADFMAHAPQASADQVIAFLAKQPAGGASATESADERDRKAGETMLARMEAAGNKPLGTGSDTDAPDPKAKSDAVWDRARTANKR